MKLIIIILMMTSNEMKWNEVMKNDETDINDEILMVMINNDENEESNDNMA